MSAPTDTASKALQLNLDNSVYGTFAEIGAGQEVARWFFKVGASSGTVAKTMSAYDMQMSDAVYGECDRYVSRNRTTQMLEHEYGVLCDRLTELRGSDTTFFALADTVRARGYKDTGECHGWMGVRFQAEPGGKANEILIHVRLLDETNIAQQEALGILGVNLLYAAYHHRGDLETLADSLLDGLDKWRIEVDMLKVTGDAFASTDNRLCALQLVLSGLTDAALLSKDGGVLQPSEEFYKRPILLQRGTFCPVTLVNMEMMASAQSNFQRSIPDDAREPVEVFEITMNNLLSKTGEVDKTDFLRRASMLQACGKTVLISKFARFHRLAAYFARYRCAPVGIVLGLPLLESLFEDKWYEALDGGILESFGRLFKAGIRLYVYPVYDRETGEMRTVEDIEIPKNNRHLFQHLYESGQIESLVGCGSEELRYTANEVREMQEKGDEKWKTLVPAPVAELVG
ncbi:TonB-dependent receptor [Verrucomicrobiales bacterium]|nr:TonB-dependent receptor [Verrucomicrobiales bacterium]